MQELVILKNEQALTDSLTVAEMFGKEHSKVVRTIENIIGGLPKNGDTPNLFMKTWYKHPQNGERYSKYLMNRDGFSLLVMGFTGPKALEWKLKYISAFNAMEKVVTEKKTAIWLETRQQGKLIRRDETNIIQKLVEYAKDQGSTHADMLYMTYSKLANKMAGITSRDQATTLQLNDLSTMERIIAKAVIDGMSNGMHYKDIYKLSKERLETVTSMLEAS